MSPDGLGTTRQNSQGKGPRLLQIFIAVSALYFLLLAGQILTIPTDSIAGNFSAGGFRVHHLLANQEARLEQGDVILKAGERSIEEWAVRWLSEWPPTPNPWKFGLTLPYTVQRGTETFKVDVTLDRLSASVLARWIFSQLQTFTGLVFLAVATLVLWRRPHELAAQLWFASSYSLFFISIDTELVEFQIGLLTHRWIFWLRTADTIFYWITFCCALHLFLIFPEKKRILDRFPLIVPMLYMLMPVVTIGGTLMLAEGVLDGLYWLRRMNFLMGSAYLILGGACLLHSYLTTRSITTRKQLNIVLWGTLIGLFPYIFLYSVPLALSGRQLISPNISALVMLVMPISFALAIIRYRLFEIDAILNRGLVYAFFAALLLAAFAIIFLGIERLLPDWPWIHPLVSALLALAAIVLFIPLRAHLQRRVDRLLYGSWYNYRTLVMETSRELSRTSDLQQLSDKLLAIAASMRFQAAALLWPEEGEYVREGSYGYEEDDVQKFHLPQQGSLAHYLLENARPLPREEVTRTWNLLSGLAKAELTLAAGEFVHTWLPLVTRKTMPGILVLGARQERLAKRDLDILTTVAEQAALAADNVNLVETLRAQLAEVEQTQEELRVAQRRLGESREGERLRMARELHDGPIQDLQGVRLRLNLLDSDAADAGLTTAQSEILHVIDELRATCQELRPPSLGPFGLEAAMRSFSGRFQETYPELKVHLDLVRDRQMLPERKRLALFRIYQEALNNVAQHAQASQVHSRLYLDNASVHLEISDDGRGFQVPRRLTMLAREGHLGLLGSVERAESIGGCLEVISKPGQGTLVRASLPLVEIGAHN